MNTFVSKYIILLLVFSTHYCVSKRSFNAQRYTVDFDISMRNTMKGFKKRKRLSTSRKHHITDLCKKFYQKNNLSQRESLEDVLIPKIVHLIWVGPKDPPKILDQCLRSIKKHLPEWKCIIWTDKEVESLTLKNQEFYDAETNYGAKSDILRYELLYRYGGVYLDVDMIVLQPLDVLNHTYEFYTGLFPVNMGDVISNSLIASIPQHPILRHCIDSIAIHRNEDKITHRTGPFLFEESFYECTKDLACDRVIAFPKTFFYPLNWWEKEHSLSKSKQIRPETFTVHLWAGTWKGQPDSIW